MNERVIELALIAKEYAQTKPEIYAVAYDKKFAELLIRKCAEVASNHVGSIEGVDFGLVDVCLDYFGVQNN